MNLRDLVNQTFDFGEQLLSAQREFAHRLMQAAAPAMRATEEAAEDVARHIDDGNERDERTEQIQQANQRSEEIHEEANQRSERIQQVNERDEQK